MEEAMIKHLAIGTLAILAVVLTLTGRADAGASASAPSKYSRAHQQIANQQATRNNFAITEYSSSSARNRSHCSATAYC
jgi:hypothetical protein